MGTKTKNGIETVTVRPYGDQCAYELEKRTAFGWNYEQKKSNYRPGSKLAKMLFATRRKMVFTRAADIPNKEKLNELESQYEKEEEKRRIYVAIDPITAIILLILLIIPGVIYLIVKVHKKHKIRAENRLITERQKDLAAQAQRILKGKWDALPAATPKVGAKPQAQLNSGATGPALSKSSNKK